MEQDLWVVDLSARRQRAHRMVQGEWLTHCRTAYAPSQAVINRLQDGPRAGFRIATDADTRCGICARMK